MLSMSIRCSNKYPLKFLKWLFTSTVACFTVACLLVHGGDLVAVPKQTKPSYEFLKAKESLLYKVTYLGLLGGYATIETDPVKNTNEVQIILKAKSSSWIKNIYELNLDVKSVSRKSNFATLYYEEDRFEHKRYYYQRMQFLPEKKVIHYYKQKNDKLPEVAHYQYEALNILSALHLTRTLDLSPNKLYYTHAYHRKKLHTIGIRAIKRMEILTAFGKKKVIVIVPEIGFQGLFKNTENIFIYLSDDSYRMPLLLRSKLIVGSFKAELIEGYPP